jgi:hypothetical protein
VSGTATDARQLLGEIDRIILDRIMAVGWNAAIDAAVECLNESEHIALSRANDAAGSGDHTAARKLVCAALTLREHADVFGAMKRPEGGPDAP